MGTLRLTVTEHVGITTKERAPSKGDWPSQTCSPRCVVSFFSVVIVVTSAAAAAATTAMIVVATTSVATWMSGPIHVESKRKFRTHGSLTEAAMQSPDGRTFANGSIDVWDVAIVSSLPSSLSSSKSLETSNRLFSSDIATGVSVDANDDADAAADAAAAAAAAADAAVAVAGALRTPIAWSSLGFIKLPKVGGTTLSEWILQPLAKKRGLKPLRRKRPCVHGEETQEKEEEEDGPRISSVGPRRTGTYCTRPWCIPAEGPYGVDGDDSSDVGSDDDAGGARRPVASPAPATPPPTPMTTTPPEEGAKGRATIILDHTFFNQPDLSRALAPPVLYFALFRRPDDILRSMYGMAYVQWRTEHERFERNGDDAFCQSLTDGEGNDDKDDDHHRGGAAVWYEQCPAPSKGSGLARDYLTNFGRLEHFGDGDMKSGSKTVDPTELLTNGTIVPLLQERFDESLVLLSAMTGVPLNDMVYIESLRFGKHWRNRTDSNWSKLRDSLRRRKKKKDLDSNNYNGTRVNGMKAEKDKDDNNDNESDNDGPLSMERQIYDTAARKFNELVKGWFGSEKVLRRAVNDFRLLQSKFKQCVHDLLKFNNSDDNDGIGNIDIRWKRYREAVRTKTIPPFESEEDCGDTTSTMAVHLKELCSPRARPFVVASSDNSSQR